MHKYYEEELPNGYSESLVIDANDKNSSYKIRLIATITAIVLFNALFFAYVLPRFHEVVDGFSIIKCLIFIVCYILYITMHELTHGIVYKLMTKQKLVFGFKLPAAYCGVPDIYVYRSTSLVSLFAPFTIYSILFILLFFIFSDPFSKMLILVLLAMHITGCSGDLYSIGILLFKLKDPTTLRKDTGPKQIYYIKE